MIRPLVAGCLEAWKQSGVSQLGSTGIRSSVSIHYYTSCSFNDPHGNHLVGRKNYEESPRPATRRNVLCFLVSVNILVDVDLGRTLFSDEICRRMHEHLKVLVNAVEGYNATQTGGNVWE